MTLDPSFFLQKAINDCNSCATKQLGVKLPNWGNLVVDDVIKRESQDICIYF